MRATVAQQQVRDPESGTPAEDILSCDQADHTVPEVNPIKNLIRSATHRRLVILWPMQGRRAEIAAVVRERESQEVGIAVRKALSTALELGRDCCNLPGSALLAAEA